MRSWKVALLALAIGVPLQAFAFLGMNAGATLQGPLPAWTKQFGSKGVAKTSITYASATDSSGNVYAAGYTDGNFDGKTLTGTNDYILTKYDSSGTKLWTVQAGVASKITQARGVTTDSSGNVIICGYTTAGLDGNTFAGTQDFFVIKFDSTGTRLWTRQLGVASGYTYAYGVATDSSGNIFVTGTTSGGLDGNTLSGSNNSDSYVTKYDSSGTKLWTKQMGPAGTFQLARSGAVATDTSGNVFIAGYTSSTVDGQPRIGLYDSFLIKFNSAGTKQWTVEFGGADMTQAMSAATDSSGNVFVAGYVDDGLDGNTLMGSQDFFVVKFDNSGAKVWTRQLGAPGADVYGQSVRADSSGNVFVGGYTDTGLDGNTLTGSMDLFVTKYNSSGTKQWTQELGTPSSHTTFGRGLAVDSSGNVFMTGSTQGDLDGNTRTGISDIFITKYNSSGSKLWTKQNGAFTGSGGYVSQATTALDTSGNIYVAGYTTTGLDGNTQTGTEDFFVARYSSSGARLWTRQLGVASQDTEAYSVTTDSLGNVFVAGDASGGLDGNTLTGYTDFFVTKYDSSGTKQWTKQLGAASASIHATGVASDSSGNIYVAGSTDNGLDGNTLSGTGNTDLFFTKYNSSGTKVWTRQMGPTGTNNFTYGMGMAVDPSGNIFIAGYTNTSLDGQTKTGLYDLFIVKYDSSGTKLWTRLLGAVSALTYTNGVTTDASGNVVVTGYTTGGVDGNTRMGNQDFFVTKYDTSGNKQWTRQMGVATKNTGAQSVAADTFGNVFVAGYTKGALDGNAKVGNQDMILTKYTATGVLQWTKQLGVAAATIFSYGAAIDSSGRLYVSGTTNGGLDGNTLIGSTDFFVSQYIGN